MKILYLAQDPACGERAARALHGIAQNVALARAQTPASALQWLRLNPEAAAVVVVTDPENCAAIAEQVLPGIVGHALVRDRSRRHELVRALGAVEAAGSARIAGLEAQQAATLARESRICKALQERVFDLEDAVRQAEERRSSEAGAFAGQLAKRHAEFTALLAQTLQARDALTGELAAATADLDAAQQARRTDAAAAAEHLRRREGEFAAALGEAGLLRETLEQALTEAEVAGREVRAQADAELDAARERYAALEDVLAHEADVRSALEHRLAAMEAALEDAARRHAKEQAGAAADLADAQQRYEAAIVEHRIERLALERQLTAAVTAYEQEKHRADVDLASAAIRETVLAEQLMTEAASRIAVEGELAGTRADAARRTGRLLFVASAYRRRGLDQKAALDTQLAEIRLEAKQQREKNEALEGLLATARHDIDSLHRAVDDERQAHAATRLTGATDLERVAAEHGQLRQTFERLQSAFQMLDEIAGEHAAERTRLESVVAARDSELHAQAQRHRAAVQAAEDAFAEAEEHLRRALVARHDDVARLERESRDLRRDLNQARARVEALRRDADRVPGLETELDANRKERRSEFERAPYGLCRCTPAGVIVDANHSFVAMLGRRRADDVRNLEFSTALFDCAGDLGWLLERTQARRASESVETTWKTRDGRDLVVRLQASATPSGFVDIVAEDITGYRALEERLRRAQRMEAVGRLASEVAVTCDTLLGAVARGVRDWATAAGDAEALRLGDHLMTDISRAASHLRQLRVYGDQQVRTSEPVSVQSVLRDLAPVLKGVIGDRISLVLAKSSSALAVDVESERLERVLVNVAGYARARMPGGGQMRIDVATAALGRRFIDKYPHVRPGHHVLITVTELPGLRDAHEIAARDIRSPERPDVDLGTLVDLVGTCGGHLWLEAQPAGNLVVKIYLPRPAPVDGSEPTATGARASRSARLARWFRATQPMKLRA